MRHRILVVDDDPSIHELYTLELEEEGYEVIRAWSGTEGIELFDVIKPDIVLLDILMPDLDGMQVLKMMKKRAPNTPIIMSTAYDYRDDFDTWACDAYIIKSSDLEDLKYMIDKLLLTKLKKEKSNQNDSIK